MSEDTQRWELGDVTVTAIVEAETGGIPPELFFPEATADDIRSTTGVPEGTVGSDGTIGMRVQAFVVEVPGCTALVDPCVGNGKTRSLFFWNELQTPWFERFTAAGFTPDDIDLVVHTHLHEDHIGWDTVLRDGEWVPTFPGARHIYVDEELDHWSAEAQRQHQDPYADSIKPVIDAGLAEIVTADADLGHGLQLISTPGHTPGHVSLAVGGGSEPFVVTGDLLHHPAQCSHPLWAEIGDTDPDRARETRRAFFDHHARAGTLLGGTHFPIDPVGRVAPHGGAWKFVPGRE